MSETGIPVDERKNVRRLSLSPPARFSFFIIDFDLMTYSVRLPSCSWVIKTRKLATLAQAMPLASAVETKSGEGVRGYLQQAEGRQGNTARFIFPSPFACLPQPRLQRATQDRVVSRARARKHD